MSFDMNCVLNVWREPYSEMNIYAFKTILKYDHFSDAMLRRILSEWIL